MHESLSAQTIMLMNIDLLKSTDAWKAKWREIKDRMAIVSCSHVRFGNLC
jgi:hypothetical protein